MTGEADLSRLIASMRPRLSPDVYVFATLPPGATTPEGVDPVMTFREAEGLTLILAEAHARAAGLAAIFPSRMITLDVHSSLEAVGFIAAVATRLALGGLGVNPVAGYHHDHLFVAADRADEAMAALEAMSAEARACR